MEDLARIERKFKKLRGWIILMMYADKENLEEPVYVECCKIIDEHIDLNLEQIDEARVYHAHGEDISSHVKELKHDFNFLTHVYRELFIEFNDP